MQDGLVQVRALHAHGHRAMVRDMQDARARHVLCAYREGWLDTDHATCLPCASGASELQVAWRRHRWGMQAQGMWGYRDTRMSCAILVEERSLIRDRKRALSIDGERHDLAGMHGRRHVDLCGRCAYVQGMQSVARRESQARTAGKEPRTRGRGNARLELQGVWRPLHMAHDTPPCHHAGHAPLEAPIASQRLAFGQDEGPHLPCVRLPCYDVADIDDARRAGRYACECEERRLLTRDIEIALTHVERVHRRVVGDRHNDLEGHRLIARTRAASKDGMHTERARRLIDDVDRLVCLDGRRLCQCLLLQTTEGRRHRLLHVPYERRQVRRLLRTHRTVDSTGHKHDGQLAPRVPAVPLQRAQEVLERLARLRILVRESKTRPCEVRETPATRLVPCLVRGVQLTHNRRRVVDVGLATRGVRWASAARALHVAQRGLVPP